MWNEGAFTFDTNILLNAYRYSGETQQRLFEVLKQLRERVWLPHQVASEYHRHRIEVIDDQRAVYAEIEKLLDGPINALAKFRHLVIDINQISQILSDAVTNAKALLEESRSKDPDLFLSDNILETITDLFDGKVGQPYSDNDLLKLEKEAQRRIDELIPPGYMDARKKKPQTYGDVIRN